MTPATPDAAPAAPAAEAPPPGLWINGIHLSAQLDAGIIANPCRPATGLNWGQLFTDHANQVQLNQLLLTANKPLDPKNTDYQWGFKVQFMYGSDARYTQFLGELNRVDPDQRYQLDVVEANVLAHLPWLTEGGIDLKAGQYTTPLGYETIDPVDQPVLLAFVHLPVRPAVQTHRSPGDDTRQRLLGCLLGGRYWHEHHVRTAGRQQRRCRRHRRLDLNLMDGKLTILALTHFGPDDATRALSPIGFNANGFWRFYNDVLITWKASDTWTFITEANWARTGLELSRLPARQQAGERLRRSAVCVLCADGNGCAQRQSGGLAR